jgi:hypothetical protein
MKLLHHGWSHPKNKESIIISCHKFNIEYEYTDVLERIYKYDYDILWLPCNWISPDSLSEHIKIIYGPHFCVFPTSDMAIVGPLQEFWKNRCFFTALSDWNTKIYIDFVESFKVPILPLPFGVNTEKFLPNESEKKYDFLVMFKNRNLNELNITLHTLNNMGKSFVLFQYGNYKEDDYINCLHASKGVLWIGRHESQGFGFQEALSCNIPILVWDVKSMFEELNNEGESIYKDYNGKQLLTASAASLWDPCCGELFHNFEELEATINLFLIKLTTYRPREFVLKNLTHEICFGNMLKKLNI